MKVFLTSGDLEQKHVAKFRDLLGKEKVSKALFITTASVPYGHNPKPDWLKNSLKDMAQFAETIDETSLEEGEYIPKDLNKYGFIFIAGGNTFYLAHRLKETKLDEQIKTYVKNEGVFSGSSAGAIILMNDIEPYAPIDDPDQAPENQIGLDLIDFAILPHADNKKYGTFVHKLAKKYTSNGQESILINDNQVLVINGEKKEVV